MVAAVSHLLQQLPDVHKCTNVLRLYRSRCILTTVESIVADRLVQSSIAMSRQPGELLGDDVKTLAEKFGTAAISDPLRTIWNPSSTSLS